MKTTYILLSIMLFAVVSFADQVYISGSVLKQDGAGIEGAELRLKNSLLLSAKTDATGAFTLAGEIITPISYTPFKHSEKIQVSIHGKYLTMITNDFREKVTVSIVNSRGRAMFKTKFNTASSPRHTISLAELSVAQGLYLVSIRGATVRQVYKMVVTGNTYSANTAVVRQPENSISFQNMRVMQDAVDTLIVTAGGYKHKVVDILTYDSQSVVCTLSASNPWIPTGALDYEGGMVKIMAKGYDFEMGQPDPNIWGDNTSSREQPVHTVSFTYDFWMDTVEVPQKDYETIMSEAYPDYESPEWLITYGLGDSIASYCLMWGAGALYCNARSKKDGYDTVYSYDSISGGVGGLSELINLSIDLSKNGYRLPTEAEWEYACRGGTFTDYYWGKNHENYPITAADSAEIGDHAVWTVNSFSIVIGDGWGVHPVGEKTPNAYGLYDMIGNLYEWCNDWDSLYTWDDAVDPVGADSSDVYCRVARGGSWGNNASHLRAANRYFIPADYLYYFLGFRVVRKIE